MRLTTIFLIILSLFVFTNEGFCESQKSMCKKYCKRLNNPTNQKRCILKCDNQYRHCVSDPVYE